MQGPISPQQRERLAELLAQFVLAGKPREYGSEYYSPSPAEKSLAAELLAAVPQTWDQLPWWIDRVLAKHPGEHTQYGQLFGALMDIAEEGRPKTP